LRTIWWDEKSRAIGMIDQTLLPERLENIEVRSVEQLCEAIQSLRVRGAPALGAAGGYGVALTAARSAATAPAAPLADIKTPAGVLRAARPPALPLTRGGHRAGRGAGGMGQVVKGGGAPGRVAEDGREGEHGAAGVAHEAYARGRQAVALIQGLL